MKTFHICYLVAKELCTGINIQAIGYIEAVKEFNVIHGQKDIVYITQLAA
jgi:hypothetical protein